MGAGAWIGYAALFLAVTLLAAGATLYVLRSGRGPGDGPGPSTSTPGPPGPPPLVERDLKPQSVSASASSKPAADGCKPPNAIRYEAANLIDGDVGTAWRADGDGTGTTLEFDLGNDQVVSKVGLIPGYVKRDPCSGEDRWPQMRRVKKVTWSFDDGAKVTHELKDQQARQLISTNQTKPTRKIRLRIDATTGPGDAGLDFTPISEVYFSGGALSGG